jgi:hypothetical protein
MKRRKLGALLLVAAMGGFGGCVSENDGVMGGGGLGNGGGFMNGYHNKGPMDGDAHCGAYQVATVPGVMGPHGEPIERTAPFAGSMSAGESMARADFVKQFSPEVIAQTDLLKRGKIGGEILQAGYQCPPGGCGSPIMPASMQMPPGCPPGGPGPFGAKPPAAVAAVGAMTGGGVPFNIQRTEVRFTGPNGMRILWYSQLPDGKVGFGAPNFVDAPGRYNFSQACIYRLKLTDIPNRPGLELYPTMEVVPTNARTATFLAHSAVPVTFTEEDFAQVAAGNYVVKVIYLPDPQFQDLASTGPAEVVSSPLEPGVDPIAEAHRRGSILIVVRMGNIDLEAPNTPAMDAPNPYLQRMMQQQQQMQCPPGGGGMGPMVPYGAVNGMGGMPPQAMMSGPGMMMPPPGMMPPGMMPPGMMPQNSIPPELRSKGAGGAPAVPTNGTPPVGAPGPVGQANDGSAVKQAKFSPAKKADAPGWSFSSLWPFGD